MSWASDKAAEIYAAWYPGANGIGRSTATCIERAIRETIEEGVRRCEAKAQELAFLRIGDASMRTTWHEAAAVMRAMLEDK